MDDIYAGLTGKQRKERQGEILRLNTTVLSMAYINEADLPEVHFTFAMIIGKRREHEKWTVIGITSKGSNRPHKVYVPSSC